MNIKILGAHNCETREYGHTCFVIDDVLAVDAGSLTSNLSIEEQKNLQAVILSHRHYDHIRDITAFGANLYYSGTSVDIYASQDVIDTLNEHFFTSGIYTNLAEKPPDNPTLRLNVIESLRIYNIEGYEITPVPVNHINLTTGFKIVSPKDKQLFYTSDTGPGLKECWENVSPNLLIIEVTENNLSGECAEKPGHLTPNLLKQELISFKEINGYLPDVVAVHMNPLMEEDITRELSLVEDELDCRITPGYEGMEIIL
ncbi:MAG: lactamase [Dehalococcoidales bacterium]|nr:MAG: lactamase [Dehalococcoidales bacterium]